MNDSKPFVCAICNYSTNIATSLKTHIKGGTHKLSYPAYCEKYEDIVKIVNDKREIMYFVEALLVAEFRDTDSFTSDEITDPETTRIIKMLYLHSKTDKNLNQKQRQAIVRVIKHFDFSNDNDLINHYDNMISYTGTNSQTIEYLSLMFGDDLAKQKLQEKADRVSGENNPGFQHGGRLSKFSKNFVNYTNEEDRKESHKNALDKRTNFNTRLEYYTNQGMSTEEAKEALYDRQGVGAKEKFIERAEGDIETGTKNWKKRQEKWQETLNNKTDEEKRLINISKRTKTSFTHRSYDDPNKLAHVYFIQLRCKLTDTIFYKIGATTKENTKHRFFYGTFDIEIVDILAETSRKSVVEIGELESKLHKEMRLKIGTFDLGRTFDGWTECYSLSVPQAQKVKNVIRKI